LIRQLKVWLLIAVERRPPIHAFMLSLLLFLALSLASLVNAVHIRRTHSAIFAGTLGHTRRNLTSSVASLFATITGDDQEFDYVVIGGGTAGLVQYFLLFKLALPLNGSYADSSCSTLRKLVCDRRGHRSGFILRDNQSGLGFHACGRCRLHRL
jgi:hypothetical protein